MASVEDDFDQLFKRRRSSTDGVNIVNLETDEEISMQMDTDGGLMLQVETDADIELSGESGNENSKDGVNVGGDAEFTAPTASQKKKEVPVNPDLKRKRKKIDDDEEYDPTRDPSERRVMKKKPVKKGQQKSKKSNGSSPEANAEKSARVLAAQKKRCFFCYEIFETEDMLHRHLPDHVVDEENSSEDAPQEHPPDKVVDESNSPQEPLPNLVSKKKVLACDLCMTHFDELEKLNAHKSTSHFSCDKCDFKAVDPKESVNHVNTFHNREPHPKPGDFMEQRNADVAFDKVRKMFTYYFKLKPKTMQNSKPMYVCLKCTHLCSSQTNFMNHLRNHRREDWLERVRHQFDAELEPTDLPDRLPFACCKCNYPLHSASEFNNHMHNDHRVQIRLRGHDNILKALEAELHHHSQAHHVEEYEKILKETTKDSETGRDAAESASSTTPEQLLANSEAMLRQRAKEKNKRKEAVRLDDAKGEDSDYAICQIEECGMKLKRRKLYLRNHFLMEHGAKISFEEVLRFKENPRGYSKILFCKFGGNKACDFATLQDQILVDHVKENHGESSGGRGGGGGRSNEVEMVSLC